MSPESNASPITRTVSAPRPPGDDPPVPAGPYWDALRRLKRVRVGRSLSSGIVISRFPGSASYPNRESRAP
jgi:hypothetical protein